MGSSADHSVASSLTYVDLANNSKSLPRRGLDSVIWFLQDQWFLVALGCLIAIASQHPVPASQQDRKELLVLYICPSVIFFINGCTLPTRMLLQCLSRWRVHLFVQIQSFCMTSLVMFGVVSATATDPSFMDPGLLVGLLVLGCVPTT